MHWAVQTNIFNERQYDSFLDALSRLDVPYSEHKVVPFIGELEPALDIPHKNVICIGSYSMRHIAKRMEWNPGVFDILDKDFLVQRDHWGSWLLNCSAIVDEFRSIKFPQSEMFVRPITDSKAFSGKIFRRDEFEEWQKGICEGDYANGISLRPDTLVQMCYPIEIYAEYRFWIVKNQVVTYSLYKRGDRVFYSPEVDDRFIDFVKERIAEWSPHETFVIDVADTEEGIKIVEPNTLNSAGFYAGDMQRLVFALHSAYDQGEQ